MMLQFSQDKQIVLITLIDMGVDLSIIHGKKLSCSYISQLLTDFLNLIALYIFHPEGFGYIILNPVDNKPHFFSSFHGLSSNSSLGVVKKNKFQKTLV